MSQYILKGVETAGERERESTHRKNDHKREGVKAADSATRLLDATMHLYKRSFRSVRQQVRSSVLFSNDDYGRF